MAPNYDQPNHLPETRARAALRCTAGMVEAAKRLEAAGELDFDGRRADLLRVAETVRQVSDRRLNARLESIDALLELGRVDPRHFEVACADVDSGERLAAAEAEEFMAKLWAKMTPAERHRSVYHKKVCPDHKPGLEVGYDPQPAERRANQVSM